MEKKNISIIGKKDEKENNNLLSKNNEKIVSLNDTPKYLKRLRQSILKIKKEQNEKEKNIEKNINLYKKIKIIKNEKLLDKIYDKRNPNNLLNKRNKKIPILKRNISHNPKINRERKSNEKNTLSSFNILSKSKKRQKDFLDVTSKINYLLERNQNLLMKEDNNLSINNFNYYRPHYINNLHKNIFKENNFSSRNGMFGKKENLPLFYEFSLTHRNNYLSKSEKNRHEIILNELNKLKFYLGQNPNDELLIIKDFLQKFHIKNIYKYSDEMLIKICKLLCKMKPNQLMKVIKPDSNIKKMIYNFLNISFEINKDNKINYNRIYSPQSNFRKIKINKNKTFYNFHVNKRKKFLDIYDTNSNLKYLEKQKQVYILISFIIYSIY